MLRENPGGSLNRYHSGADRGCDLQACSELPSQHVAAVYRHWLTKQVPVRRPLLQRLWFQAPWHSLGVQWGTKPSQHAPEGDEEAGDASDGEACLPFVGRETPPHSAAVRLPTVSDEEALARLQDARCLLCREILACSSLIPFTLLPRICAKSQSSLRLGTSSRLS